MFEKYNIDDLYLAKISNHQISFSTVLLRRDGYTCLQSGLRPIQDDINSYLDGTWIIEHMEPLSDYYNQNDKKQTISRHKALKVFGKNVNTFYEHYRELESETDKTKSHAKVMKEELRSWQA